MPTRPQAGRLDRLLAARYGVSRSRVQGWIKAGRVRVDGRVAKSAQPIAGGEWIECAPLPRLETVVEAEDGPLVVLHEDADVVVLDKPARLAVHPGAGRRTGTLAHRLLARYPELAGIGGPGRPGIVHRLDIDTTGVLVVARSPRAYTALARDFAARRVEKIYLAVVYGEAPAAGTVDRPLGRHPRRRREMTVRAGGRAARTAWRRLASAGGISLLEVRLETGRTHQIRVHLKASSHPLVGDPTYGEARWRGLPRQVQAPLRRFPRPALHAWRLAFEHPASGAWTSFEAPVPEDLQALWSAVTGAPMPVLPGPPPPSAGDPRR